MGMLFFLAVIALVVGGPLVGYSWRTRPKPGQTEMVLLADAAGDAELALWKQVIRPRAGVDIRRPGGEARPDCC